MSRFGPEAHLLSVVDDWAPYYIQTVQQVMDGTWKSEDYWGGIHEGDIKIASISDRLTDEQRKKIDDTIEAIGNGSLHPFAGPLKDQSGKLRVPEGKDMTKEELAGMNWYVEGMTSTLPK